MRLLPCTCLAALAGLLPAPALAAPKLDTAVTVPHAAVDSAAVLNPADRTAPLVAVYRLTGVISGEAPLLAAAGPLGGPVGTPLQLGTASQSVGVSAATDGRGEVVAAWGSAGGVSYAIKPAGGAFGPATAIEGAVINQAHPGQSQSVRPQLAVDGAGDAVLAWDDPVHSYLQYSVRRDGGSFGPAQIVEGSAGGVMPRVGMDGLGDVLFTWVAGASGAGQIFAERASLSGEFKDFQRRASGPADNTQPTLAINRAGHAILAWQRRIPSGAVQVLASYSSGGGFGRPRTLASPATALPGVAIDRRGTAYVATGRRTRRRLGLLARWSAAGRFLGTHRFGVDPFSASAVAVTSAGPLLVWFDQLAQSSRLEIADVRPDGRVSRPRGIGSFYLMEERFTADEDDAAALLSGGNGSTGVYTLLRVRP